MLAAATQKTLVIIFTAAFPMLSSEPDQEASHPQLIFCIIKIIGMPGTVLFISIRFEMTQNFFTAQFPYPRYHRQLH